MRDGVRTESRYVPLRSLHPAALWLAAGSPLLAALLLLGARIGG
ncbi:hypothetical protein MPOCJGCO_3796 [Methylobacterium trifolii]|uniref:Uncharacterized protein n=1 Tax=Methylobacterium trifolii TaxID=1003092 RepID=A0ABQ4U5P0_9HYPH|nr:hypothetical protein MPOCJGCO_3796 [Methylobacterium trifolii]